MEINKEHKGKDDLELELNKMADMSEEEVIENFTGLDLDGLDEDDQMHEENSSEHLLMLAQLASSNQDSGASALPTNLDWRDRVKKDLPVKN